ncbi:MFS transporter [Mesorhizobium shangrilense]
MTLSRLREPSIRSIWVATQGLVQTVAISWLMVKISASDLMIALL